MDEIGAGLDLLKRFNRMVADHPVLSERLLRGEHDVLQWQQGPLFASFRGYRKDQASALRLAQDGGKTTPGLIASFVAACFLTACAALTRRAEVVVFSADKASSKGKRDFRIEGLYGFLEAKRLPYVEVFHTLFGREFFRNAWSRRRCAIYQEAIGYAASLWYRGCRCMREARALAAGLPCLEFEEADRPFARAMAERLLRSVATSGFRIRWYRRILKRLKPRAVLSIDDTRHYHELCAAAHSLGIPFYAFQHGLFTVSQVGWLDHGFGTAENKTRPDTLVVWSPYWKKELLRLGTYFKEDELLVGGNPKGDPPAAPPPPASSGDFGVLVPYESGAPKDEVGAFIRRFLEDASVRVYFSLRPDRDHARQLAEYGLAASERLIIVAGDLDRRLPDIHAVCGAYSTFLYDALAYRRPVLILETARTTGRAMVENGLADLLPRGAGAAELKALAGNANARAEARAKEYLGGDVTLTETLERLLPSA